MNPPFPEIFAILRDGVRNPCLQILRAYPCEQSGARRRNYTYRCPYEISNMSNTHEFDGPLLAAPNRVYRDRNVHTLHYYHPETTELQQVYYWFTPYMLESRNGFTIPLLEFQYRSWMPTGYSPVPVRANLNEVYDRLTSIQQERLMQIRQIEDTDSVRTRSPRPNIYSDYEIDSVPPSPRLRRPRTPPPVLIPQIVESVRIVEVPVERVVIQRSVLPLPKAVGELLVSHARKGADSCPITATPFAECDTLCATSCFHIFDAESLARWQETHTTCPVCRSKIENTVVEETRNGVSAV
jgi:hypothetical protein